MLTWYNSVRATSLLEATYFSSDRSVDCTAFSQDGQTLIKYYVLSYRNEEGHYLGSAGYYWGNRWSYYMTIEDIPAPVALKVTSSTISTREYVYASYGCHVRCAKD